MNSQDVLYSCVYLVRAHIFFASDEEIQETIEHNKNYINQMIHSVNMHNN